MKIGTGRLRNGPNKQQWIVQMGKEGRGHSDGKHQVLSEAIRFKSDSQPRSGKMDTLARGWYHMLKDPNFPVRS